MSVHVFGIRHHGPGSARSLLRALESLAPDLVLVEGPPEADALIPLAAHGEMRPPVALLVYDPAAPRRAVHYPFAVFSPEWQAIRYAVDHGVPVRFFDLPMAHQLVPMDGDEGDGPAPADGDGSGDSVGADRPISAETAPPESAESASPESAAPDDPADPAPADSADEANPVHVREDPLNWLARAAGQTDGERWWDQLVEHRRSDADLFDAVLEAMGALRDELALPEPLREQQREAYMRQQIRAAERAGHARIAVVCGAWHAPALVRKAAVRDDAALLKGLPKAKLAATWVPWTYGRLTFHSGYGAGVESPGWYQHLWDQREQDADAVSIRWLTRAAQLLREQDLSASTAQVIDAARLAGTLAALRGMALPGLAELNQAADAVFWGGGAADGTTSLPLRLIRDHLVVGERLGTVPAETPAVPLQHDLARQQKRLRLAPEATRRELALDLRKEMDLERSRLLHRLLLLDLPWGMEQQATGKRGTFHEQWLLQWDPQYGVGLIEAAVWGNTVAEAADARARDQADRTPLGELPRLLDRALLADLPDAARHLMARIDAEAARAADLQHLMDALPDLARMLRYGDVRGTDTTVLGHVVDGLVARIAVGLPLACASLDDKAADEMGARIAGVHGAVTLLQDERHRELWTGALQRVADSPGVHGHVQGRAVRLLLDLGVIGADETGRRMGLALSTASGPDAAGAWVDGFLYNAGLVLLHDARLFGILDGWVAGLDGDAFTQLLPLLRRTFSAFAAGERRGIGELARRGSSASFAAPATAQAGAEEIDRERAAAVLPLVTLLMGLESSQEAA